jgi:ketosteroid isomerase-like protein
MDSDDSEKRALNQSAIEKVFELISTGRAGETGPLLTEDLYFELPYGPNAQAIEIRGRSSFLDLNAKTWPAFRRFELSITEVHRMLDPDKLILEYRSDGEIISTGKPYKNRYVGIFGFRDGLVREWHEFHNPDVPAEANKKD